MELLAALKGSALVAGDVVVIGKLTWRIDSFEPGRTGFGARVALSGRWQFAVRDDATFRVYRDRA